MKTWPLPLFIEAYMAFAKSGKTVEGRVPDHENPVKDYRSMEEGDKVRFYAVHEEHYEPLPDVPELHFTVAFKHHYSTIEDMLENEDMEQLLPGVESIDEGVEIYLSLPDYRRRVELYGVYAIGLKDKEIVHR
jgi:ASC-1-like (ASCH) protein